MHNRISYRERKRLAIFLRAIRISRGYGKQQLAEKAGYESAQMVSGIENCTKAPSHVKIRDLANALDVSIEQLKGYGKIQVGNTGWPVLTEEERIGLYLFAPILRVLSDEDRTKLLDYALLLCRNKEPEWRQTEYQKKKRE